LQSFHALLLLFDHFLREKVEASATHKISAKKPLRLGMGINGALLS
jgi:hypothetical protein